MNSTKRWKPKPIPVTDDLLDAPDGSIIKCSDGITRERIGDQWEVRTKKSAELARRGISKLLRRKEG